MNREVDLTLIKQHEACSSKKQDKNIILNEKDIACNITVYPYKCPANKWTIGWGCVIEKEIEKYKNGISVLECEELLQKRVDEFLDDIETLNIDFTKNELSAILCLVFNIGFSNFKKSSVLKDIKRYKLENASNKDSIIFNWKRWNKATVDGKLQVLNGLVKRREEELDLFFKKDNIFENENILNLSNYIKDFLKDFKDYFWF